MSFDVVDLIHNDSVAVNIMVNDDALKAGELS